VIYQQTLGGLPVWDAKLSVTVNEENQVVNSFSSLEQKPPDQKQPPDDAKYMQNDVTEEDLGQLLALPVSRGDGIYFKQEQKQQRLLVYRYHK
jgi:Zn-dependent metalloprotease